MIRISRATEEDIQEAAANALEVFAGEGGLIDGARNCLKNGVLYALHGPHGDLIGVVGGVLIWPGVASAGSILTRNIRNYPIAAIRTVRLVITKVMSIYGLHRVEMAVKKDYPIGHRWAKALGFEAEGTLRKYSTDKSDYIMYGRTT